MNILTLDNTSLSLNNLPETVEDDTRFAVLDNSNPLNPDFFFVPLIYLESFNAPAMVLKIGDNEITMPLDWCIAVGDSSSSTNIEIIPLTSLNDRGFSAFQYNPLSSFSPTFLPVEILDIYNEVTWYAPRLRNGQFLCVPLSEDSKPQCVYFVKEVSRNCEIVDYNQVF